MPIVTQSPSREPWVQSRTWSMAALAALAAEERPRASMMAAPRFCTIGMKVFSSQAWSLIIGQTFFPSASAWNTSGYCVAEWLPQTVTLRIVATGLPILCASCEVARLWSSRIMPLNCDGFRLRSEEHTSELQSPCNLVCRLLLEKKKKKKNNFKIEKKKKQHEKK